MSELLEACPSFAPQCVDEVLDENLDEQVEGGRLFFVDAGAFVHHLVSLKIDGRTAEFPAVFDVFERLLLEGDSYVRNPAKSATSRVCT
jgi:hypothetical protein